jgi:hypothetical protein
VSNAALAAGALTLIRVVARYLIGPKMLQTPTNKKQTPADSKAVRRTIWPTQFGQRLQDLRSSSGDVIEKPSDGRDRAFPDSAPNNSV